MECVALCKMLSALWGRFLPGPMEAFFSCARLETLFMDCSKPVDFSSIGPGIPQPLMRHFHCGGGQTALGKVRSGRGLTPLPKLTE